MLSLLHLNFHLLFVLSFFHLLSSSPVFLFKFHLSFLELQFVFFKWEFSFPQCRLFFVTSLKSLHCCQTAATLGNYRCLATSFSVKLNVSNKIACSLYAMAQQFCHISIPFPVILFFCCGFAIASTSSSSSSWRSSMLPSADDSMERVEDLSELECRPNHVTILVLCVPGNAKN